MSVFLKQKHGTSDLFVQLFLMFLWSFSLFPILDAEMSKTTKISVWHRGRWGWIDLMLKAHPAAVLEKLKPECATVFLKNLNWHIQRRQNHTVWAVFHAHDLHFKGILEIKSEDNWITTESLDFPAEQKSRFSYTQVRMVPAVPYVPLAAGVGGQLSSQLCYRRKSCILWTFLLVSSHFICDIWTQLLL